MTQLSLDFAATTERSRNARVWLWLSYLASREADAISYSQDVLEKFQRADEVAMLDAARDRFVAKADEVGGKGFSKEHWRSAIDEFLGEKST